MMLSRLLVFVICFLVYHRVETKRAKEKLKKDAKQCGKSYKPVCAMVGKEEKTFLNKCVFGQESKKGKIQMKFLRRGPCKIWKRGSCPEGCQDIWAPICGTDQHTYSSLCSFKMKHCSNPTKRVGVKRVGYCRKDQCPESCPEVYRPICCSNGVVYANECEMRLAGCRAKKTREFKKAKASKCKNMNVESCPNYGTPVCGSDGLTYPSECELHRTSERENKIIQIAFKGSCSDIEEVSKSNQTLPNQ